MSLSDSYYYAKNVVEEESPQGMNKYIKWLLIGGLVLLVLIVLLAILSFLMH